MYMFVCAYCNKIDNFTGNLKCETCHKEYCRECCTYSFIHEHRIDCIHCSKDRIYIKCDSCHDVFDILFTKHSYYKCCHIRKNLCLECFSQENHKCYKNI